MRLGLVSFMTLAAVGLLLSICAHLAALFGLPLPGRNAVFGLHVGIFVVWLPAVIVATRTTRAANRKDFWRTALSGCPVWMRRGLYMLFAYAILNFVIFMVGGTHGGQSGGAPMASEVRGFSGHWMMFYAAAFAILYSAVHAPHLLRDRKCANGHAVAPTAQFCPECGSRLVPAIS
ncbi:MAG: zinc ribbon domain-containing protein [Pseudomonadota bacterium]|nr:zinc ribbon domain-containing protein [Pseudomonadota bacterium]